MENTAPITALGNTPAKQVPLTINPAFISSMNGGTFTLHNTQKGTHRTFRVRTREGKTRVGLLNGPDNTANFVDFATITIDGNNVTIKPDAEPVAPKCPKCGKTMRLREQRKGAKAGRKFWGCSDFPNCVCISRYETNSIGAELRDTYSRLLVAVIGGNTFNGLMRVLSSGACAICGRKLTTPESIDRSIGSECWGKIAEFS
jgi:predicted RNA-binding Zn-ribbon protein involved in translation (DUF1610 family)